MRAVFGLVMLIGIGLAGFAVYMVNGYVSETQVALDLSHGTGRYCRDYLPS